MSQNKTVIPGLEQPRSPYQGGGSPYAMPNGGGQMPPQPNLYQRSQQPTQRRTVVPGMNPVMSGTGPAPAGPAVIMESQPQQRRVLQAGKPVLGFLYTISRTAAAEFWPLCQGPNTIGQSPECDIQLAEATVSGSHAELMVRKQNNGEVIAWITDAHSTNGTMLNGKSLGFNPEACKNGDIITIGDSYELLIILIDQVGLGLKVKDNFIAIETAAVEEEIIDDGPMPFMQEAHQRPTRQGDFGGQGSMYNGGGYVPANGTIGLDGSGNGFGPKGGTVTY